MYPLLVHTFTKWSYFTRTCVYYHCCCYACCYREVSELGRCEMKFAKARRSGPEALRVIQLGIHVLGFCHLVTNSISALSTSFGCDALREMLSILDGDKVRVG